MKELVDFTIPGAMISQIWPNSREKEGETLRAIETVLEYDFYNAIQTVEIPTSQERKQVASMMKQNNIPFTYCVARVLNEKGLNLSDLNEDTRKTSCDTFIKCLDEASEAGASSISFISGPRPKDPSLRKKAIDNLQNSLMRICNEAKKYPNLKVLLEPMDINADKKNTFGTAEEARILCEALKGEGLELFLCIDTAHTYLNNERPINTLKLTQPYVKEFHFCNCITDESQSLFGDKHIPFGAPGVLDKKEITNIMEESLRMGYYNEANKPIIFWEVLNRQQEDPVVLLNRYKSILEQAWEDVSV